MSRAVCSTLIAVFVVASAGNRAQVLPSAEARLALIHKLAERDAQGRVVRQDLPVDSSELEAAD